MIGDDQHRNLIKEQYGFADWGRGRAREVRRRHALDLPVKDIPLPRIERQAFDGGYIDTYGDGQKVIVTVWIYQHASPDQAHEALLDYLMTSMAPRLPDAAERGLHVGDVAFAGYEEAQTSLAFVRNDVFVRVHSVGETDYPIGELAGIVDQRLQ
jgi:hypothetical protein